MPIGSYFAPTGSNKPKRGGIVVDITDYGGVADGTTDNGPAFKAAYAALRALLPANTSQEGLIYFPGATNFYKFTDPIQLEHDWIGIIGDSGSTRIWNQARGPAVLMGLRTTEPGPGSTTIALDATFRPSRAGKLDGTFGGRGIRTKGIASVIFSGTPFDLGRRHAAQGLDRWRTITQLTVEFAIEAGNGGALPPSLSIFHLGGYHTPTLIGVRMGGGTDTIDVEVSDSAGNPGYVSFLIPNSGMNRCMVQIDLAGKTAIAGVNGVRVAANISGAAFGGGGTGIWGENSRSPFLIGSSRLGDGRIPLGQSSPDIGDFSLYGLLLANGLRYNTVSVGATLTRIDAGAISDAWRYASDATATIAFLDGGEPIDTDPTTRHVWGRTNANRFLGYFCHATSFQVQGGILRNSVRGCNLQVAQNWLTPVIHLGPTLDTTIEDCRIEGGTRGIACWESIATYITTIRNCQFNGNTINPIYAAWSIVVARDCFFQTSGRVTVEAWACDVKIENGDIRFSSGETRNFVRTHGGLYGGHYKYDFLIDYEGDVVEVAPFEHDQQPTLATFVECTYAYIGSAAVGRPVFKLNALPMTGGQNPAIIKAQFVDATRNDYSARAWTNGEGWRGTIHVEPSSGPGITFVPTYGSASNLTTATVP